MLTDFLNGPALIDKLSHIALVLVGAYLAKNILNNLLRKSFVGINHGLGKEVRQERIKTLRSVISNLGSFLIVATAIMIVLSELGIDIAPLIAGVGVLGLGVGFASQTLVKDYISGFFILLENQFNVGDLVEIGGKRGIVKELSLRTTTLRDDDGTLHIIPNSQIATVTRYRKG
jgi:small-conductance mechanosensitive channel